MEVPSRLLDFNNKIHKAAEIGLIYLSKYMDWMRVPEPNISFLTKIQSNKGLIRRLLLENINKNKTIEDADRICSGELRVFSIEPKMFKNEINWHKDYYTDHEWPIKPFNRIYDPNDSGIDLNVPFNLSRLQFIPTLIQAFEITSDSKYIIRLTELIDSWIDKNPYCFGVNWWSSTEVGLRAVNLVLAVAFLSKNMSNQKLRSYLRILWKHALYIYKYDVTLDRVQNKNNHYLASMLGLLAVSFSFKGNQTKKFQACALNALKREIPRQFMEDGGNFESATGYHQLSLEVVLVGLLLLRVHYNNDVSNDFINTFFKKGIQERLVNALNFVWDYMSCYGESPHIGDSSDCRVIVFKDYFDREASDHNFLVKLGELAINYKTPSNTNNMVKIYPKSGYACFKNHLYSIIAFSGPKGTNGTGGHGHNDKCSFVMTVSGYPIFIDCGTYIYNPKIRERYELKSGKSHNTVMIDGEEQCEITPNRVFGLQSEIISRIGMAEEGNVVRFEMQHDGYRRVKEIGLVSREIICEERSLEINDTVHGSGTHNISI
ncbi:MAG: alginate lyase family protein, partial [bacterium]